MSEMKILRHITAILLILLIAVSCEKDEESYSFDNLSAPANVSVVFDITQDNSGLVTIIPNAEGATKFEITFGDTDDETPTEYKIGEEITHIYEQEGTYIVGVTAIGLNGKKTSIEEDLLVSFNVPENLEITVENDLVVSKQVNISATADYATLIEFYFGELAEADDTAVVTTPGETVSHIYENPGDYEITVIAKSGAIETLDSTFTFTVTEITGPQEAAPTPPGRAESDYISIFSDVYTNLTGTNFNPNWGQSTIVTMEEVVEGDTILKYSNLNYQGTEFESSIDVSEMEYLHLDMWTDDATTVNFYVISEGEEKGYELAVTPETWVSYDIPLSYFDNVDSTAVIQFKVDGTAGSSVYFDNIYFYKDNVVTEPTEAAPAPTEAEADVISMFSDAYTDVTVDTWKTDWSSATLEDVNVDGNATKKYSALDFVGIETASNQIDATDMTHFHIDVWSADITTFKIKLVDFGADGAYGGGDDVEHELTFDTPAQGEWVSYDIPLSDFTNLTTRGNLAQYILVAEPTGETAIWVDNVYFYNALPGTWQMAPEAGSMGVGPAQGDMSWWAIDAAGVTERDCFYDDSYVFETDGSFSNVLGTETWIETWQGGSDACGTPVSPHDGTAVATYTYDQNAGTVTIDGKGAYLGIPKPYNGGELDDPANAPASITYLIALSDNNTTMTLDIEVDGAWWRFKLVKN